VFVVPTPLPTFVVATRLPTVVPSYESVIFQPYREAQPDGAASTNAGVNAYASSSIPVPKTAIMPSRAFMG
jgi:hypothetical protein